MLTRWNSSRRAVRVAGPSAGSISLGVAKINTDSDLRLAALGRMRQVIKERPDIFILYELMGEMEEAIRSSVEARIRMFGSEGKGG